MKTEVSFRSKFVYAFVSSFFLLISSAPCFADEYIVVIQSPHYYGVLDEAASQQDQGVLENLAKENGYNLAIISPPSFDQVYSDFLIQVPEHSQIASLIVSGHAAEGVFRYSDSELLDSQALGTLLNEMLDSRTPTANLQVYLAGCLTACQTDSESALHHDVANEIWNHLPHRTKVEKLTVVGHLSTSESGRYAKSTPVTNILLKSKATVPIRKATLGVARKLKINPIHLEWIPLVLGILSPLGTQIDLPETMALSTYIVGIGLPLIQRLSAILESKRVEVIEFSNSGRHLTQGSIGDFFLTHNQPPKCQQSLSSRAPLTTKKSQ